MSDPATGAGRVTGPVARVLVLLAVLAALPGWAAVPARAAADPVAVTLQTLSPGLARAGAELRLTGSLDNRGSQDLRNVEVRLRLSDTRLNSRAELAAVAEGRTSSRDGDVVAAQSLPDLDAGAIGAFDLSRPLDDLAALADFGVYVLGVEVLASRSSGFGRVAILRTLLPWVPGQTDFSPTGFSWLWPLVAHPTRLADGTFADDSLAAELEPGGRLARLVESGVRLQQGAGLTWAVDPELLDAVTEMADAENPYQVLAPDGSSVVPGGGAQLAAGWLEQLRAATFGRQLLALPYGDPDLTAVTRAGLGGDVVRAREQGQAVVKAALPSATMILDTVWPTAGFASRDALGLMRRSGVTTAVLDGRALPTVIDLSYTPAGHARFATRSGRLVGLLAEPGLADLLRRRGTDPLLGAQRLLAETAMITSELPSTGTDRVIVVMPPRRWDPSAEYLDRLVEIAAQAPWMAPVSLTELADDEPPEVDRGPLHYPRAQRDGELSTSYLRALERMHSSIDVFATILTDRAQLLPELNRAVLLLESSWWRGRDDRAIRHDRELIYLTELRASVQIQPGSFTFSSRRGTIPLTVANGLDQKVRVRLRLDPQTIQLRLTQPNRIVPIGPGQKKQEQIDAVAVTGGQVVVDATLFTPSGVPYGQPVQLEVSITDYGTVALYITLGAAAVLFLTAGIRVLRRVLVARRRDGDGDGDDGDGEQPPDAEEPR